MGSLCTVKIKKDVHSEWIDSVKTETKFSIEGSIEQGSHQ